MSKMIGMKDTFIIAVGAIAHAAGRIVFILADRPELFYVGELTTISSIPQSILKQNIIRPCCTNMQQTTLSEITHAAE